MNRRQRRKRAKRIVREWVPFAYRDFAPEPIDPAIRAAFAEGMRKGLAQRAANPPA